MNQVRGTYFAYGISLNLSCDPQGSVDTWTSCAGLPDQEAQLVYEYRENELTLAGVVKEDLTCSGSSLPKKKGGPARVVRKRTSPQAHKLSSLTRSQAYDIGYYKIKQKG